MMDITYSIECLPEDILIEGNAIASGDDKLDKEVEDKIREDLESGNGWAWCCVRVVARLDNTELEGDAYLGGCSYKSEEDFIAGGYYEDLKEEAREDLLAKIEEIKKSLKE